MRARIFPQEKLDCGWYGTLPPPGPARRLQGDHVADWVVVGAGFTGLSAARRLAEHEHGRRVVLLEAQRVGLGASGRNSGFVVELGRYHEKAGQETNQRLIRLGREGIARLRRLVQRHAIDCSWNEAGRLHVAVGDLGRRSLDTFCSHMQAMGEPFEVLDAEALTTITGTTYYCAAVRTGGDVQVQPAALVRGLAAALPGDVELYEESPVWVIEPGATTRVVCPEGSIRAARLLLTTNAFTPAFGLLKHRVFPMSTFASLTRPLREVEQNALGGQAEWGVISAERVGSSVRRTRDGRILIRSHACYGYGQSYSARSWAQIRAAHQAAVHLRFPVLRDVPFEYTWGGVMSMSANDALYFGRVRPGIFAVTGDNGHGVAMGTLAGELVADLAADCSSELLGEIQKLPAPSWIPSNPLLRVGVQATSRYLHWRSRSEL